VALGEGEEAREGGEGEFHGLPLQLVVGMERFGACIVESI